mgnify:CR=1 FL=1|jgi:hypothetical protein
MVDEIDRSVPAGLKVSAYRRKLIMSGLRYDASSIEQEEGAAVVRAIKNYRVDKN